jgi:hypothetical protein
MSNINKRVKELEPHVLSIRFTNNITVIDCAFKDGWAMPKSDVVGSETTAEKPNYYMLYPLNEDVGIDEMLDYVNYIIKVNIEREMKIQLLQVKINELKTLFTKSSLEKCKTITFQFKTDLNTNVDETINLDEMPILNIENAGSGSVGLGTTTPETKLQVTDDLATGVNQIKTNDGDSNIHNVNPATAKFNNEEFDLPPKKDKIVVEEFYAPEVVCKCDPMDQNQVCPACI